MTTSRLGDAVTAVQLGFHIFPLEPNEKTPIRIHQDKSKDDAPWTVRWSEIATNDINTVVEWWTYAPNANIGIACKPSSIFVVDCDRPKSDHLLRSTPWAYLHDEFGPRPDGETVFYKVAERYGGPEKLASVFDTYTVTTGSGGVHYYYRWPEGVQSSQDSIARGVLDVRGNGGQRGGYVLADGSVTDKGPYRVAQKLDIAPAPAWLIKLCSERPVAPKRPNASIAQPRSSNFSGLVDTVRNAADGNLNNSLLWAARAMCADGGAEDDCIELLAPTYVECNGRGGHRQAEQTIRSAYRLQGRK